MVTAREAFEAKKLAARYGVVGKVAARYRMAGYEVRVESAEEGSKLHFTAVKPRDRIAVRVYWRTGPVPESVVEELASAAGSGFKPVLVLYGAGPKITPQVLEKARGLGVSVRRVRA